MNAITQSTKITSSDINTLISECNNKLSLSGGTMSGVIIQSGNTLARRNVSDDRLIIFGGTNAADGSYLRLSGKDEAGYNGKAIILATDGTNTSSFEVNPNGTAIIGGKTILTSAGGTVTGALYFGGVGSMGISDNADYRTLWINRNSGNAIGIFDTNSPSNPGTLLLRASNGSSNSDFWLYPDGKATLGGHSVITSAGGTMTGYIKHNVGDILSNIADNQWTSIKGGSGYNKGAAVTLYGQDYNDGQAELIAYKDGVGTQKINIHPSNGVTTDKIHTSELEIKYSKLYFQGDVDTFITRNWDTTNGYYYLVMQAGTWGSCGRVEVYDNESPHEAGAVALIAADKRFVVYPNGIARMNGELQANYLYMHPQNNDKEGGELKLAASNSNLHHIICDNYNDNFRILFQNSSGAVPYIYNFSKDGRISTPTGSFWIA